MTSESILIAVEPEKDNKVYKCEINVSELGDSYQITLNGFFPDSPNFPYVITLNDFIASRIKHDYKPTDQEGNSITCRKNADFLRQLVFEVVNYIHSKVGDFKSIAYQGTNHYLNFDTLKVKFPDIERK